MNQFSVGDTLILHSPFTGEDTRVNYRGECGGGKAVVIPLPKGLQFAVPVEWLREMNRNPRRPAMSDQLYVIHSVVSLSFLTLAALGAWSLVWREVSSKHKHQQTKGGRKP